MQTYFDADVDAEFIKNKTVAIIGYGNQGKAHAENLRDSGVLRVIVALREGSVSTQKATQAGFEVMSADKAAALADVVMMLTPDETHAEIYQTALKDTMQQGATLMFAHGLNVHFGLINPRDDLDVVLVAPKGPGHALRAQFVDGKGLPCLVAVHRDVSGTAKTLVLSYAAALGGGRSCILETSFKQECETDMFGEQAVLCGGIVNLIHAGYETLTEAGYEPEMAYFECIHEVKLIVDLIHERGIAAMRHAISNTAEYGGYKTGERIITDDTRAAMKVVLDDIQSGAFVDNFMKDYHAGTPEITANRDREGKHPSEDVGKKLRSMMPWIK